MRVKITVCVRPCGGISIDVCIYVITVRHDIGKRHRHRVIDIVPVASAIRYTPKLCEADSVLCVFRRISVRSTSVIILLMSTVKRIVYGQRTVSVNIRYRNAVCFHYKRPAVIWNSYINLCFTCRWHTNKQRTRHSKCGGKCKYFFLHF